MTVADQMAGTQCGKRTRRSPRAVACHQEGTCQELRWAAESYPSKDQEHIEPMLVDNES